MNFNSLDWLLQMAGKIVFKDPRNWEEHMPVQRPARGYAAAVGTMPALRFLNLLKNSYDGIIIRSGTLGITAVWLEGDNIHLAQGKGPHLTYKMVAFATFEAEFRVSRNGAQSNASARIKRLIGSAGATVELSAVQARFKNATNVR